MKGLILAGGRGTRLRPLTDSLPKQLIPVANRPILHYVVDQIEDVGISRIGVIVSPESGPQIRRALDHRDGNVAFSFIEQAQPLGLAHAVHTAQGFLGEDPFLMYLGDNLIGGNLRGFVTRFRRSSPAALVLLKEVADPRLFGVARLDGADRVIGFVEKPEHPPSNLALVGIYAFSPLVHRVISQLRPSHRGELEITDALQLLIDGGYDVPSVRLRRWWLDTGKSDDLLEANRVVLSEMTHVDLGAHVDRESEVRGSVRLAAGACIERSVVHGPVVVGAAATIRSSSIGPYVSIGDRCHVTRSAIADSVVLDEARIESASLAASVVGARAEVIGSGSDRPGKRILVAERGKANL